MALSPLSVLWAALATAASPFAFQAPAPEYVVPVLVAIITAGPLYLRVRREGKHLRQETKHLRQETKHLRQDFVLPSKPTTKPGAELEAIGFGMQWIHSDIQEVLTHLGRVDEKLDRHLEDHDKA